MEGRAKSRRQPRQSRRQQRRAGRFRRRGSSQSQLCQRLVQPRSVEIRSERRHRRLEDYNQAIQLQSNDASFFNSRGHANYRLGQLREALADYNRAVQLDPQDATSLLNRGDAYREQGMYGPAASDYRDAIRINPKLGRAYLQTAWLMSTCPDQRFRDVDKAISTAERAIELDGEKDYRYLDTLAAAQASAGKFDDAKATANKALSVAPMKETAHVRQRLELYENGRAFREGAPAEPVRPASARAGALNAVATQCNRPAY